MFLAPVVFLLAAIIGTAAVVVQDQAEDANVGSSDSSPAQQQQPLLPAGLLEPIPEQGGLPPIYAKLQELSQKEKAHRAKVRQYTKQIRQIRHKYLGRMRREDIHQQGIERLREFTDPAAFLPLIEELAREQDDVRLAMLDHFAAHDDEGQAALVWVAIYDNDPRIRNEALMRIAAPLRDPAKYVLDRALRRPEAKVVNAAASVAASFNVLETIPLLIFAQANVSENEQQREGDLAWIAIQTQRAYVAGLAPAVGSNVGAFQPIIGVVSEGSVVRVMDAVVIEYRTVAHRALVNMTSNDWGRSTARLGYDVRAWWSWYNDEYLPFKRKQMLTDQLASEAADETDTQDSPLP